MTESNAPTTIPEPQRRKFSFHVISAALAILALVARIAGGYALGRAINSIPSGIGAGVGAFIFAALFAYVVGYGAYRITGRSNLIGNIAFCLVLLMTNTIPLTLPTDGSHGAP